MRLLFWEPQMGASQRQGAHPNTVESAFSPSVALLEAGTSSGLLAAYLDEDDLRTPRHMGYGAPTLTFEKLTV